ncbi:DUF761 domain-containing protein, partial [Cephalotus follicularis]
RIEKRKTREAANMKNTSIPSPCYSSPIIEAKEDVNSFREINRAMVSHVTHKKLAAARNKVESKPSMDINESADAFIKKFRKELMIQRLQSIENYEQMLARGL